MTYLRNGNGALVGREEQPEPALSPGSEVSLRESALGYEAGACGIVMHSAGEAVQVRFRSTGHTVSVKRELLEPR